MLLQMALFHSFLYLSNIPLWASLVAQTVKNLAAIRETTVWSLGREKSPEGGHGNPLLYSCLENPHGQRRLAGYIQSMRSQRVGYNWAIKHSTAQYSIAYMYHIFFIHSYVNWHLGCFHVLSIVNSVSVITGMQVSMFFSGYMPRSGIVGSHRGCF